MGSGIEKMVYWIRYRKYMVTGLGMEMLEHKKKDILKNIIFGVWNILDYENKLR